MRQLGLVLMALIGIAGVAFGAIIFAGAESAVHEIEALICFLIGAVGIGFASMIGAVEAVRDEIEVSTKTRLSAAPPTGQPREIG